MIYPSQEIVLALQNNMRPPWTLGIYSDLGSRNTAGIQFAGGYAPKSITRKLPPYGRKLLSQGPGESDELRVYFGSDENVWKHTRVRNICASPALLLPPGSCANDFNWPVAGWQILAIQLGKYPINEVQMLAMILLESGASIVRILYGENPDLTIYRPVHKGVAA